MNVRFTLKEGCCMMLEEKIRKETEMSTGCIKSYVRYQGKRMY